MPQADYTYDRDADCFVVTDGKGNEVCRTRSPKSANTKRIAAWIAVWAKEGTLIFPKPFDRNDLANIKSALQCAAHGWPNAAQKAEVALKSFPTPGDTTKP